MTAPAAGTTLTCTITNTQLFSTVRVVKQWVGPASSATIFVDQNGTAPFDASRVATANGDSASFDYPLSTGAFVGETAVPTDYTATIQCGTAAPAPYTGGPFAVTAPATAGATLICTIKNSINPATVRVEKQWDGAPASTTIFVDQDGTAPFDASVVADSDGDNTSFDYLPGTAVFVGETMPVPAGYAATIQCGTATPQPYSGGPFAVTAPGPGATLTCTITNTQQLSTVRVIKQWDGAPASTTIFVDQDGAAPFQASTVATADGHEASFVYPVGTATTVGETPIPAGYSATIDCGGGTAAVHRRRVRGHLPGPAQRHPHLHDHEQTAVLDRARRQAVGRRTFLGNALRRPERRSAIRRLDGRYRRRAEHLVRVSGRDPGDRG